MSNRYRKRKVSKTLSKVFHREGKVSTVLALNENRRQAVPPLTVPIVGLPRGGTSMVAAVVEALGVDLGPREDLDWHNFEDQTVHHPDWAVRYKYIQQRNEEVAVWGWKDPTGLPSVQQAIYALRNPHVIIVFRDQLAAAQGEMRFDASNEITPRSLQQLFASSTKWLADNIEFACASTVPTLLVSYERAMVNPPLFVDELAAFLQLPGGNKAEAIASMSYAGYIMPPGWSPPP